jgi:hypothetical protein
MDVQHKHHWRRLDAVINDFVADTDLHVDPCFAIESIERSGPDFSWHWHLWLGKLLHGA